ncbi:hypothetical protein HYR99_21155 [Candidatus Poribacteria bacterium]|nr:hypothetical protein [Candidatus Poribacteria bacterium]
MTADRGGRFGVEKRPTFCYNKAMAIQWHPLLAQFLRHHLSDRIQIQDSIPLGEMPLEMDLLFLPQVPIPSLPSPYNHLGRQTIGEFKGAGDTADWDSIAQIEAYACLYQRQQKIADRKEITLWVIASAFSETFTSYLQDFTEIGEGVGRGTLAGFPLYRIDLETLPITIDTMPLLLVYKGDVARETAIAQFFIDHYDELHELSYFIKLLHPQALEEVLKMLDIESMRGFDLDLPAILRLFSKQKVLQEVLKDMNIESLRGFDLDLPAIISLFGKERILRMMDAKEIIQTLGREKILQSMDPQEIIQTLDPEMVLETVLPDLTDEEKKALRERISQRLKNPPLSPAKTTP